MVERTREFTDQSVVNICLKDVVYDSRYPLFSYLDGINRFFSLKKIGAIYLKWMGGWVGVYET